MKLLLLFFIIGFSSPKPIGHLKNNLAPTTVLKFEVSGKVMFEKENWSINRLELWEEDNVLDDMLDDKNFSGEDPWETRDYKKNVEFYYRANHKSCDGNKYLEIYIYLVLKNGADETKALKVQVGQIFCVNGKHVIRMNIHIDENGDLLRRQYVY